MRKEKYTTNEFPKRIQVTNKTNNYAINKRFKVEFHSDSRENTFNKEQTNDEGKGWKIET